MSSGTTSERTLSLPASPELGPMKPSKPVSQACRKAALSAGSRAFPKAATARARAAGFRLARPTHSFRSTRAAQLDIRRASQAGSAQCSGTLDIDCKSAIATASDAPPALRMASTTSRISCSLVGSRETADAATASRISATARTSTGASRPNHSLNAERATFRRFARGSISSASSESAFTASSPSALRCFTRALSSAVLLASTCCWRSSTSPSVRRK
mmetsp:Transcript_52179/g.138158  ORF Transcript_52179/g.138158 Transcript_52179/m.138158 type:complete len:217 (-) Transcript_52179:2012-2662(-)